MDMMRKKPELLSPAGDMEKLKMAVAYGADAVYLAGTSFGMRSFAGNFSRRSCPLRWPMPMTTASGSTSPSIPCPAAARWMPSPPIWSA